MIGCELRTKSTLSFTEDIEIPEYSDTDVLIKTVFCGICGSDIFRINQTQTLIDSLSNGILGHEVVGLVQSTGKNVKSLNVGDYVAVKPLIHCNNCDKCKKGLRQHCTQLKSIGKDLPGGFGEYFACPEINAYKLRAVKDTPMLLPYVMADVVAVCLHALDLAGNLNKDLEVAIIGDGPIGVTLAVMLASKSYNITIYSKHSYIQAFAEKYGFAYINCQEITEQQSELYDVVFEAVGGSQGSAINQAIDIARKRGKIIALGVYALDIDIPIYLRKLFYKELTIVGANSYGTNSKNVDEFHLALKQIHENNDVYSSLVTHKYAPSDIELALKAFTMKDNTIKVVVDFSSTSAAF